ncbi:MAG TPA: UdgX family uracil-DNA binding protein [Chthoniobacteraceae bacterium]|jgi:DNA polymerase|nr:UdgX family uracil-DNA binding protein [Chthoniobacteraceae bacterium]
MPQITFAPTFEPWQRAARLALQQGIPPEDIEWQELESEQPALGLFEEMEPAPASGTVFRVPKEFLPLARKASFHRDERRWALLYRVLWRLTHGEPKLLEIASDPDVIALHALEHGVRREVHKMHAFVRFREVRTEEDAEPWYVAWFEPEHHIVEMNAQFFIDRFTNMCWSILTPERCLHWNRKELSITPGVAKSEAPTEDAVESLWLRYYSSIFNPARVKARTMQQSMPKKYWKNLPEAAVIPVLLQEAPPRVDTMMAKSEAKRTDAEEWHPARPPETTSLRTLATAAAGCQACPLYKDATQTVFGEGPRDAEIVLLGEQPGDQEDLAGHPFVGPAGLLLDRALGDAGVDREKCYVTNVVKHFKWEPRGKRRLHQTPNSRDIAACRPWMEAELGILQPRLLVCLGATAAKAVFGPAMRVTQARGKFLESLYAKRTLVTVHPSSLLRAPTDEAREENYKLFVADLRRILEE